MGKKIDKLERVLVKITVVFLMIGIVVMGSILISMILGGW